ncbi:MAG: hypothetical protein LBR54_05095 [Oscillospiraceae bacterium]|jgi:hypothetical protein|nr:hypothetical protein [Oscillospiraceae bacterium]
MNNSIDTNMSSGFVIALSQNEHALKYFSGLPKKQQNRIISQSNTFTNKTNLREFINNLSMEA